ncbi:MAG: hypothetical protein QMB52_11805 [Propionivibrio sp.]
MFDQVTIRLLEGKFICESTWPDAFRWLSLEESQQEVAAYLERIGRRLTTTPNGVAYYTTWKRIGSDERSEVKRVFVNVKQMIRPVIHFISLCMEVEKKDTSPAAGDRVDYAVLLKAVTENPHLFEVLREFGTMGKEFTVTDASAKGMLDKVIQQMERWGYLILINREQESYRFTGKLDYYYDVLEFLMDPAQNEGIADPMTDEHENAAEQRGLL